MLSFLVNEPPPFRAVKFRPTEFQPAGFEPMEALAWEPGYLVALASAARIASALAGSPASWSSGP
jgi:hypothetical protein